MYFERSIGDLVALCFEKWKSVVCTGIVVAVLLAIIQFGVQMGIKNDPEMSEEAIEQRYQAAMYEYKDQINLLTSQNAVDQGILENAQSYVDNSLSMKVDPYNKCVSVMDIAIEVTDDEVFKENVGYSTTPIEYMVTRIQNQYMVAFNNIDVSTLTELNNLHPNIPEKYWEEVLRIEVKDGGILEVFAYGPTIEEANTIVRGLYNYLESKTEIISQSAFEHALVIISDVDKIEIDTELGNYQNRQRQNVVDASTRIEGRLQAISEMVEPVREQGFTWKSMFLSMVEFALLGVAAGLVLAILGVILHGVLVNEFASSREIERVNRIITVGAISKRHLNKKSIKRNLAQILAGEKVWSTKEDALAYISAAVKALAHDNRVLLTSSIPLDVNDERISAIAEVLKKDKVDVTIAVNGLQNANFVEQLPGVSAVVLLEETGHSRADDIAELKERCISENVKNVGFVLLQQ